MKICVVSFLMVCGIIKRKLWIIIKRSILDPSRSLKDTMERYQFFENLFSEDVGSALFGGPFSGNFMSPDNTSDGWLRKMGDSESKRVLLKSWSGVSQQELLNEVLANMICDRLKHCHSMSQNHSANIMRNRSL